MSIFHAVVRHGTFFAASRRTARQSGTGRKSIGPQVHSRAWLEWRGQSFLGQGRQQLLELVEKRGSISAAAREMGVSYRAAWSWINEMNRVAGTPLVEATVGGKGGGGARLTPTGHAVLTAVGLLQDRLAEFNERINIELSRFFARHGLETRPRTG